MTKVEYYALVNESGEYLYFEQVGNHEIEVYPMPDAQCAESFESFEKALLKAKEITNGDSNWDYILFSKDEPSKVVKVALTVDIIDEYIL